MLGTVLLTGCGAASPAEESYGYSFQGDTVRILDEGLSRNLRIVKVDSIRYSKDVVCAGTVRPIPTQYANIASPFAGRVVRSFVKMGQWVQKGMPLFEIICPDFTDAQKEYFQAKAARDLAVKDLRRKEDLAQNGVSSQKELEEAQNALLIADKDYENATSALHVYQVDDFSKMTLGQPLIVRAPIDGLLIENGIVVGQYLRDDSDPVAVVADLSHVWVSSQVKEKDIRFIREDGDLEIGVAALPGKKINGKVYHIEEAVDEDTRSICVLSVCENPNEMLKLGMYTTTHFISDPLPMYKIPETALLQGEEGVFVFVQLTPRTFVRRKIKVETTKNHFAIVEEGLKPGEKIIGQGGYYLKM